MPLSDLMVERLGAVGLKVPALATPCGLTRRGRPLFGPAGGGRPDHKQVKLTGGKPKKPRAKAEKHFAPLARINAAARREAYAEARALRKEANHLEGFLAERAVEAAEVVVLHLGGGCRPAFIWAEVRDRSSWTRPARPWSRRLGFPFAAADRVVLAGDAAQLPPYG